MLKQKLSQALMLTLFRVASGSTMAWIVWVISACFALLQFSIQLSSSSIIDGLIQDFHLSAFSAALLLSSYYYIYVVLQVPAGILIDRFGPRRLLTFGAIACVFSCYLFAHSTALWMAFTGRILLGGGLAFAYIGMLSLISRWFPIERFAFMVSIAEMAGMLGAAFSGVMVTHVVQAHGWRSSISGFGLIALLLAVLLWSMVRDAPKCYSQHRPVSEISLKNIFCDLKLLLKRKIVWANALYAGFMFAFTAVFVGLWGINFLVLSDHISRTTASVVSNIAFVGFAFGSPVVGIIDGCFRARRLMMSISPCLCFLIFFSVLMLSMPLWLVSVLMCLLGFFSAPYILSFAIGNEIAESGSRATSIGFVNAISVASAVVFQPLVGYLLVYFSRYSSSGHYTLRSYHLALGCVLLSFVISMIIGLFLPERPELPIECVY